MNIAVNSILEAGIYAKGKLPDIYSLFDLKKSELLVLQYIWDNCFRMYTTLTMNIGGPDEYLDGSIIGSSPRYSKPKINMANDCTVDPKTFRISIRHLVELGIATTTGYSCHSVGLSSKFLTLLENPESLPNTALKPVPQPIQLPLVTTLADLISCLYNKTTADLIFYFPCEYNGASSLEQVVELSQVIDVDELKEQGLFTNFAIKYKEREEKEENPTMIKNKEKVSIKNKKQVTEKPIKKKKKRFHPEVSDEFRDFERAELTEKDMEAIAELWETKYPDVTVNTHELYRLYVKSREGGWTGKIKLLDWLDSPETPQNLSDYIDLYARHKGFVIDTIKGEMKEKYLWYLTSDMNDKEADKIFRKYGDYEPTDEDIDELFSQKCPKKLETLLMEDREMLYTKYYKPHHPWEFYPEAGWGRTYAMWDEYVEPEGVSVDDLEPEEESEPIKVKKKVKVEKKETPKKLSKEEWEYQQMLEVFAEEDGLSEEDVKELLQQRAEVDKKYLSKKKKAKVEKKKSKSIEEVLKEHPGVYISPEILKILGKEPELYLDYKRTKLSMKEIAIIYFEFQEHNPTLNISITEVGRMYRNEDVDRDSLSVVMGQFFDFLDLCARYKTFSESQEDTLLGLLEMSPINKGSVQMLYMESYEPTLPHKSVVDQALAEEAEENARKAGYVPGSIAANIDWDAVEKQEAEERSRFAKIAERIEWEMNAKEELSESCCYWDMDGKYKGECDELTTPTLQYLSHLRGFEWEGLSREDLLERHDLWEEYMGMSWGDLSRKYKVEGHSLPWDFPDWEELLEEGQPTRRDMVLEIIKDLTYVRKFYLTGMETKEVPNKKKKAFKKVKSEPIKEIKEENEEEISQEEKATAGIIRTPITGIRVSIIGIRTSIVGIRTSIVGIRVPLIGLQRVSIRTKTKSEMMLEKAREYYQEHIGDLPSQEEREVLKLADYFSFKCRQVTEGTGFKIVGKHFRKSKNWIHLKRIYELCEKNGWDYRVYIDSQFERVKYWKAHQQKYPFPNQCYSEKAQVAYEKYCVEYRKLRNYFEDSVVKPVAVPVSVKQEIRDSVTQACQKIMDCFKVYAKGMARGRLMTITPKQLKLEVIVEHYDILSEYYLASIPWILDFLGHIQDRLTKIKGATLLPAGQLTPVEELIQKIIKIQSNKKLMKRIQLAVEEIEPEFKIPKFPKVNDVRNIPDIIYGNCE